MRDNKSVRAGALIVVCASCGPSSAIEVVVDMNPQVQVDSIKIYVGMGYRLNETREAELLVPEGYHYPDKPTGLYFKRQRELESDTVTINAGDTEARWVFQPGTHDELSVIAIGYVNGQMKV